VSMRYSSSSSDHISVVGDASSGMYGSPPTWHASVVGGVVCVCACAFFATDTGGD